MGIMTILRKNTDLGNSLQIKRIPTFMSEREVNEGASIAICVQRFGVRCSPREPNFARPLPYML